MPRNPLMYDVVPFWFKLLRVSKLLKLPLLSGLNTALPDQNERSYLVWPFASKAFSHGRLLVGRAEEIQRLL